MSKIVLLILAAVLATALCFPAVPEQETPILRVIRAAAPDPHHKRAYGLGYGIGGYGPGYGPGFGHGLGPGFGHGYKPGFGHGGFGHGYPYGGYPGGGYGGSSSQSVAGAISSPFGSAAFSSANAGGYGR